MATGSADAASREAAKKAGAAGGRPAAGALGSALLAALLAWGLGEAVYVDSVTPGPPGEAETQESGHERNRRAEAMATWRDAVACHGLLGASVGLALALTAGLGRGLGARALPASLAGAILGAAAGAAASAGLVPIYQRDFDRAYLLAEPAGLTIPLLVSLGIWSAVGLAAGLARALGRGDARGAARASIGGLVGGAIGCVAFILTAALVVPSAAGGRPVGPSPGFRLAADLALAASATLGILATTSHEPTRPEVMT